MDQSITTALAHEADGAYVGPGSDEYYASRFIARNERYQAWCVFALKTIVEEIILRVSDPGVARLKLAWWQDTASRANHPLFKIALQLGLAADALHAATGNLSAAIDHAFSDAGFRDEDAENEWFHHAYQAFYELLGSDIDLGIRAEQARSFLKLRELLAVNVIRLPTTRLSAHGLSASDISESSGDDRRQQFIVAELQRTSENLEAAIARSNARRGPIHAYAALTAKRMTETLADGGLLLQRKVELTPLRKLWIAWRSQNF